MEVEKKLDGFMQIAIDEAMEQKKQVMANIEEQYKNACKKYRKKAEDAAKKKLREDYVDSQREKNKGVIAAASEGKRAFMVMRAKMLDDIFEAVMQRLKDYIETPEYKKRLLEDIKEYGRGVVYLMPDDMRYISGKVSADITLEASTEDFIGGFKMRYNNNMVMDNTFKTRFNDEKRNVNILKI